MPVYEDIDKLRAKLTEHFDKNTVSLLEQFIKRNIELHEENCDAFAEEEE